jgi:hypothetical protein
VCPQSVQKSNSMSTYTQQYMSMRAKGSEDPNPRQQVLDDLQEYIQSTDTADYILIGIDANETISEESSKIMKVMKNNLLTDVYLYKHGNEEFPTHINGTNRIDFMLSSQNLLEYITRVGVLKFHKGLDSDHRGMFCDFTKDLYSNIIESNVIRTRQIGTNSTNQEAEKYIRKLDNQLVYHRVYEKMTNISREASEIGEGRNNLEKNRLSEIYEAKMLDQVITKAMLQAEKECCNPKETALWTPELYQSNLTIQYFNILNKSSNKHININHRLLYIKSRMSDSTKNSLTSYTGTRKHNLKEAIKKHKAVVRDSYVLREAYLKHLIEDLNERDTRTKTTIKNIMHREKTKRDFGIIRNLYKGSRGQGLNYIEVQDENDESIWRSITDPVEIEEYLIKRNKAHFGQAGNTVFASGILKEQLGYEGVNEICESLIQGKSKPNTINTMTPVVQQIIDNFYESPKSSDLPSNINFEEFSAALEKWNERTTTSPSGRHLGHCKILLRLPIYDNNNINLSKKILYTYYQMVDLKSKLGKRIPRWCKVTTCMIEKVKGSPKIDKLRVIHIYEADYNLILKIIWARKVFGIQKTTINYMKDKLEVAQTKGPLM